MGKLTTGSKFDPFRRLHACGNVTIRRRVNGKRCESIWPHFAAGVAFTYVCRTRKVRSRPPAKTAEDVPEYKDGRGREGGGSMLYCFYVSINA